MRISFLITIFITICLLSGCAPYECKSAYELTRDISTVKLNAYDAKYKAGEYNTQWKKLEFNTTQLSGNTVKINGNADFCALDNVKDFDVDFAATPTGDIDTGILVQKDDLVSFSIQPIQHRFDKCEDMQTYNDLNINVLDVTKCNDGYTYSGPDNRKQSYNSYKNQFIVGYQDTSHGKDIGNIIYYNGKGNLPISKFYDAIVPQGEINNQGLKEDSGTSNGDLDVSNCDKYYLTESDRNFKQYPFEAMKLHKKCNKICNFYVEDVNSDSDCLFTGLSFSGKSKMVQKELKDADDKSIDQTIQVEEPPTDRMQYIQLISAHVEQISGGEARLDANLSPAGTYKSDSKGNQYLINNHGYQVQDDGKLTIRTYGRAGVTTGGYKLKISRDCSLRAKKNIYIYAGKDVPNFSPGEPGSININWRNIDLDTNFLDIDEKIHGAGNNIYFGMDYGGDDPKGKDNSGFFLVEGSIPKIGASRFGNIVDEVNDKILEVLYGGKNKKGERCTIDNQRKDINANAGAVCKVYAGIIYDGNSRMILNAMLVLFIALNALFFMMGVSQANTQTLIVNMIKIVVVHQILQPYSWDFFTNNFLNFFIDGPREFLSKIAAVPDTFAGDATNKGGFAGLNYTMGRLLVPELWYQILSIAFTSFVGIFAFIAIILSLITFFTAIINAIIMYFLATTYNAVLIAAAPIFFAMILFQYTAKIFHAWTKVFVKNLVQVIFTFAIITLLNKVQMNLIHAITGYGVCIDCVLEVFLTEKVPAMCVLYGPVPDNFPVGVGLEARDKLSAADDKLGILALPVQISQIIALVITSALLGMFVKHITSIADSITGIYVGGLNEAMKTLKQTSAGLVGMDSNSVKQRSEAAFEKQLYGDDEGIPESARFKRSVPTYDNQLTSPDGKEGKGNVYHSLESPDSGDKNNHKLSAEQSKIQMPESKVDGEDGATVNSNAESNNLQRAELSAPQNSDASPDSNAPPAEDENYFYRPDADPNNPDPDYDGAIPHPDYDGATHPVPDYDNEQRSDISSGQSDSNQPNSNDSSAPSVQPEDDDPDSRRGGGAGG